jgi:ABC-2 type transport system permease protein
VRQIRLIAAKEFAHIKADPLMVRLILFPVLLQLFVFGYALTTEVKNTPVAVVDRSATPQSRSLIESVKASPLFSFAGSVPDEGSLRRMLDEGTVRIGVVIPSDFSEALRSESGAEVQALVDGQDANSSAVALGYLSAIASQWTFQHLKNRLAAAGLDINTVLPVQVTPSVLFNPTLKSAWYMIPALVVILVTIITSLLTGFSIVKEKERGTFEQLMVTPIKPIHVLLGKTVPFVVIGLAEILVFLVIATLWFRIPFRGNVVTLLVFALVYMISSLGIGILASTVVRTSQQVLFTIWFILIFFILLGGFFIPIENMPDWVQSMTLVNPVRFFMFIVREIFLKGSGFGELWRAGCALLAIGAVVFSLSVAAFNRRMG